jgi:hypothetical protein
MAGDNPFLKPDYSQGAEIPNARYVHTILAQLAFTYQLYLTIYSASQQRILIKISIIFTFKIELPILFTSALELHVFATRCLHTSWIIHTLERTASL